jgi:MFS family permease
MGLAGLVGCLIGGWAADSRGRAMTAMAALSVSGACCLISPAVYSAPWELLLLLAAVWGAAVIADSGASSTMLSGLADRAYAGTALTAQTAIGFLLTVVTIQLVPVLAGWLGWRYAFVLLAAGPLGGVIALFHLIRHHRTESVT